MQLVTEEEILAAIRDEIARCGSYAWNAEDILRVEEKLE